MWDKFIKIIKNNLRVVILLVLACALFLGYMFGTVNNNRDRVISKLEIALKSGEVKELGGIVTLNNKMVPKDKLEPLMDYYRRNTQSIGSDIKLLKSGMDTSTFYLDKKKGVFGDSYKIKLKSYNLTVSSNYDDGEFTTDNKSYISANDSMENIIPGVYTVNGILKSEYGDIEASKEITLLKDESVNINFDAIDITVKSKFEDADVYINDKKTDIKVKDASDIGPLKNDGSVSIYIEKEMPWGTMKSNEVNVSDIPVINLNINIENSDVKKEVDEVSEKFYKSVFAALNSEEKSDIEEAESSVKDKVYSIFKEKYAFLKNLYVFKDIEIIQDKSEYKFENNKYIANVLVKVDYSVEKKFFGISKEEKTKNFITKLTYDEENNEWVVSDVENFGL